MRMIFVNMPVKDLDASKAFFGALGFTFNAEYTSESGASMVVDENIFVMLLPEARFRDFINGDIANAGKTTEFITCLSADSRQEVDDTLAKALAAGGKAWKPLMEYGTMYGCSFQDLDGHVWEVMLMPQA